MAFLDVSAETAFSPSAALTAGEASLRLRLLVSMVSMEKGEGPELAAARLLSRPLAVVLLLKAWGRDKHFHVSPGNIEIGRQSEYVLQS